MKLGRVIAGSLLLAAVVAAAAEPRAGRTPAPGRLEDRKPAESAREAALRRAREEIRQNPKQKKFILFRYGLSEADL